MFFFIFCCFGSQLTPVSRSAAAAARAARASDVPLLMRPLPHDDGTEKKSIIYRLLHSICTSALTFRTCGSQPSPQLPTCPPTSAKFQSTAGTHHCSRADAVARTAGAVAVG